MLNRIFLWMAFLIVLLLALGGCASQPLPERHSYLLRVPAAPASHANENWNGIKRLTVPSYMESQQMMIMVSANEVKPVRLHSWGESPKEGIKRYLNSRLDSKMSSSELTDQSFADIEITEFLGTVDGTVRLRADYSVVSGSSNSGKRAFDMTVTQRTDGYIGLVDAHTKLLDLLADSVSQSVPR